MQINPGIVTLGKAQAIIFSHVTFQSRVLSLVVLDFTCITKQHRRENVFFGFFFPRAWRQKAEGCNLLLSFNIGMKPSITEYLM